MRVMAKANQAQEQTMEEILASIRRIISDDEARSTTRTASRQPPPRPANNVSHLFAEQPAEPPQRNVVELPIEPRMIAEEPPMITEAFAQAMEAPTAPDEYASFRPEPPKSFLKSPPPAAAAAPAPASPPVDFRPASPLLSTRTDAAVTSAFNQLADTIFAGNSRTIDNLVEDMLRPMLKTWLDNNLPPLVERLVREEIERVSRGRR
jgi:cell pole-organizing protein PopZ